MPINLVELATRDTATRVGQMRAYVEQRGYTEAGFTPIVTSSHGVDSSERAMAFYEQVLKMKPLIDEVLGSPESNRMLNLPEDAKTRVVFMQGNHMFGKVVLSQPLNYECESLIERAKPPNIGYLAQAFAVGDLDEAAGKLQRAESGGDQRSATSLHGRVRAAFPRCWPAIPAAARCRY